MAKKNKKYVATIIDDIRELTKVTIPTENAQGRYTTLAAYINGPRAVLNTLLIEAMLGAEMKSDKIKFNHKLPSKEQIAEICDLLTDFIDDVESDVLSQFAPAPAATEGTAGEDMGIPKTKYELRIGNQANRVTMIDKVSEKKLKESILDKNLVNACTLNVRDCLTLSAMGEKARNKANRDKMLIIGGVAILLTGAAVAGVVMYNKHKGKDELKIGDEVVDGDIPDVGDGDIPEIEDVPQVDIE